MLVDEPSALPDTESRALTQILGVSEADDLAGRFLHLTANESLMSRTARRCLALGSGDLYFMGGGDDEGIIDFRPFTFRGIPEFQNLVASAEQAACSMLHASAVTLKCLSGVQAMTTAILALTNPGDAVMTVHIEHGGHFATPVIVERTGRRHLSTSYDFGQLSFAADQIAADFHRSGARALYLDVSYYLNPHNLVSIRAAVGDDAVIIYDASHTMGLIMGGQFQQPLLEGADVIVGNTHKTLPGPQKGLLAFRDLGTAERAMRYVNNGLVSSCDTGSTLALAITILEMAAYGRQYASQVVANANALGLALREAGGQLRVAGTGRFSENHQIHLLMGKQGEAYRELYVRLLRNHISVNFDAALGSGTYIRLGTQRVTRAGMSEADMGEVADLLLRALAGQDVSADVDKLSAAFSTVKYSFDHIPALADWVAGGRLLST